MVASHNVIDVVDSSGSKSDFGEISGPNTSISIFSLILGEVRSVNVIVDISVLISNLPVSLVPFLIVMLFIMVVSGVDCEMLSNPS